MSNEHKQYKRLPGTGFLNSNRLYTGPGHILSISSTFFSEDYMRFYYKDIQAVITRKTLRGKIFNLSLGILSIIFSMSALGLDGGWAGFFYTLTGFFFLLLIINWLRGPTCACHIQTSIQTVRLPALNRIRKINRAIAKLRPLIEGAQGALPEETLRDIQREDRLKQGAKKTIQSFKHDHGVFHSILFSLLLVNGVFIAIDIFYQNIALSLMSSLITMSATVFLIVSLIKQTGSDLFKALKILTWLIVGYKCVTFISSYIIFFYVMITNPDVSNNQWELIKKISFLSPLEYPWLMGLSLFSLICSLSIGISGLVLISKFRKEYKASQAGPQSSNDNTFSIELDYE